MISYMIGKLAPNSSHSTRGLIKYVPGRGYFRAVSSQNGDKIVTSPPPPPIVERIPMTYSELKEEMGAAEEIGRNPVSIHQIQPEYEE